MTDQLSPELNPQNAGETSLLKYRIKLLAIISVFLLPFIGGWLAFYVFDYRPVSKNYGTLVSPVRSLSLPMLQDLNGAEKQQQFWNKWSFVILQNGDCVQLCKDNLYYLRQMRIALGRDMDRVQNVIMLGGSANADFISFVDEYPNLTVFPRVDRTVFDQFALDGIETGATSVLYLIDPDGNLMMTYSAVNDPSSILSDMRRLLKLSQIG